MGTTELPRAGLVPPDRARPGGLTLGHLAPADRPRLASVYQAVRDLYDLRAAMAAEPDYAALAGRLAALNDPDFLAEAHDLGADTAEAGGPTVRKALHDLRGGGLALLLGLAELVRADPDNRQLLDEAALVARDHARVMRAVVEDLDPAAREADLLGRPFTADDVAAEWHGAVLRAGGRAAVVSCEPDYRGGVAGCPLEAGLLDRVLFNHLSNAARFAADGRVRLGVAPGPGSGVRFEVENAVDAEQREWLAAATGGDLGRLYAGGLTRGGEGLGLAACAEVVATRLGVPAGEAVRLGHLGAELGGDRYRAWWHWPAWPPQAAWPGGGAAA